jgi:hypothetical protein
MPLPLYTWQPLYRRLDGAQSRSGHYGVGKNLLPLLGIKPPPSNQQPVTILTELFKESEENIFDMGRSTLLLSNNKQEVLGRTNHLLSFDMWTTQKMLQPTILLLLCVFVAVSTFLLSPCLAKVEGCTYRQTD